MADLKYFKCLLLGDGGIGKTTYVERFERKYHAISNIEVYPLAFNSTSGPIQFDVWDSAEQANIGNMRDFHFCGDCAIIMFDLTSRITYKNVALWHRELTRVSNDIPIVICGNKVDIHDREVKMKTILYPKEHDLEYFEISARSNYNFVKPFLALARKLLNESQLEFTVLPALIPPEVPMDPEWQAKVEKDLKEAQNMALPDDDSDNDY